MELSEAVDFLSNNHRSVLCTRRRDGRPQMSPVVHAMGPQGRVLISTRQGAMKVHNMRRDPSVSLCAISEGFFGRWAQVDGTASIIELPEAMPLLRFIYEQVAGQHPDWDEFERDMVAQHRVVIAIDVSSAGPSVSG